MKIGQVKPFVIITCITLLFFTSSLSYVQSQETEKSEYVILYDTSHGQNFDMDLMKGALNSLQLIGDVFNVSIIVREISSQFTTTNLQGADLLIISNPASDSQVRDNEKLAIETFVQGGGGILYLGNPLALAENITGNPQTLNSFLDDRFQVQTRLQLGIAGQLNNPTVLVDDLNNDGINDTHILYEASETINDEDIINGVADVDKILYYGTAVADIYQGAQSNILKEFIGNVSYSGYTINSEYDVVTFNNLLNLKWMMGRQFTGADGRTAVVGSTIMFSDLMYNEETKWIDIYSNKALFQNLVAWLLRITPQLDEDPKLTYDFAWFAIVNLLFAMGISLGFVIVIFANQIIPGKLKFNQIFDFSTGRPKFTKTGKATKKTKPKKSKKKKAKGQR
jgi:hypothetical protein